MTPLQPPQPAKIEYQRAECEPGELQTGNKSFVTLRFPATLNVTAVVEWMT